jgi:hypothetical protein
LPARRDDHACRHRCCDDQWCLAGRVTIANEAGVTEAARYSSA